MNAQTPATFVAVSAALGALGRRLLASDSVDKQQQRLLLQALKRVETATPLGKRLRSTLAAGKDDPKAAKRIHALACLIGTYEELEARAQLEHDVLRKKLGIERR